MAVTLSTQHPSSATSPPCWATLLAFVGFAIGVRAIPIRDVYPNDMGCSHSRSLFKPLILGVLHPLTCSEVSPA